MKFEGFPECVQEIAASVLAERISVEIMWSSENTRRTEEAKEIAKTVRDCFVELYSEVLQAPKGEGSAGSGGAI